MGIIGKRLDLQYKAVPTHEVDRANFKDVPFWVEYGDLSSEATDLLRKLESLEPRVWTDEGQETNIRLRRAFHDALGVQQIIFVFCDDLLHQVYELPWWKEWQDVLEPIFSRLGINESQVIRCLLAKLPHGTTIPVHHDTGLWSLHSHRVHIPLITSNQDGNPEEEVVFKVGHSEKELERAPFCFGRAIELNNRAKHFVQNNWDRSRVHMIFDYVEPETRLPRVLLQAGQQVFQTRRAIFLEEPENFEEEAEIVEKKEERAMRSRACLEMVRSEGLCDVKEFTSVTRRFADGECEAEDFFKVICKAMGSVTKVQELFEQVQLPGLVTDMERQIALKHVYERFRRTPTIFSVIGVMKCGTTSLYDYLTQHPAVGRAKQKEPHFFDWKWEAARKWTLPEDAEKLVEKFFEVKHPCPDVDLAMHSKYWQIFDIETLLANPDVVCAGEATPSYILGGKTLAERMEAVLGPDVKLIVTLREPVSRAYSHFQMTADPEGTEDQKKRRGTVAGRSFESLVEEDLEALNKIGADDANLDPDVFEREYMSKTPMGHGSHSYVGRGLYALQLKQWFKVFPREQFLFVRLDRLSKNVQGEMDRVFSFLGLGSCAIPDKAPKNARKYEPIDPAIEARLQAFYAPHNKALEELLGSDYAF